jgi:hypothetical protein
MDAQMAFLAKFPVDGDISLQLFRLLYRSFLVVVPGIVNIPRHPDKMHPGELSVASCAYPEESQDENRGKTSSGGKSGMAAFHCRTMGKSSPGHPAKEA